MKNIKQLETENKNDSEASKINNTPETDGFAKPMEKTVRFAGVSASATRQTILPNTGGGDSSGQIVTNTTTPVMENRVENCHAIPSVKENLEKYTKRQQLRAEQARTTYRTLGSLTIQNFKHILCQNLIKNCPVTIKDVEIAEDIYGPDITTLKGKSTRKRPPVIVDDQVDIPEELVQAWNDITLCIDNMFVQGQVFLVAINTTIR